MSALTAVPTSLERRWQLSFEWLRPLLQQPCEAAASASLHSLAHESSDGEHEVAQALLYGLLTQPHVAALLFRLMCCLRDVELAVSELVQLVLWRYAPLLQPAKQQLLWLLSQLVRSRVAGTHRLALALLRLLLLLLLRPTLLLLLRTTLLMLHTTRLLLLLRTTSIP